MGQGSIEFSIRELDRRDDLLQCEAMQQSVWGFGDADIVSAPMLKASRKHGGTLLGAVQGDGRIIGFVFGIPAAAGPVRIEHSHLLAVLPEFRNQGVARALKWRQYRGALRNGIPLITWTFEPLESKNAHLNLNQLGAAVRRYYCNLYGESTGSPLHSGLGTDRFLAEWKVNAAPGAAAEDSPVPSPENVASALTARLEPDGLPRPQTPALDLPGPALVEIPSDIQNLKRLAPEIAREWRTATRTAFMHYLNRGFVVRRIRLNKDRAAFSGLRSFYYLERPL